jgi:hypothetical protein
VRAINTFNEHMWHFKLHLYTDRKGFYGRSSTLDPLLSLDGRCCYTVLLLAEVILCSTNVQLTVMTEEVIFVQNSKDRCQFSALRPVAGCLHHKGSQISVTVRTLLTPRTRYACCRYIKTLRRTSSYNNYTYTNTSDVTDKRDLYPETQV